MMKLQTRSPKNDFNRVPPLLLLNFVPHEYARKRATLGTPSMAGSCNMVSRELNDPSTMVYFLFTHNICTVHPPSHR
jgi:hypothetical protein